MAIQVESTTQTDDPSRNHSIRTKSLVLLTSLHFSRYGFVPFRNAHSPGLAPGETDVLRYGLVTYIVDVIINSISSPSFPRTSFSSRFSVQLCFLRLYSGFVRLVPLSLSVPKKCGVLICI